MDNADPQARTTEIQNLVASNDLNTATKRLMDFVTDFSNKNHKRIVINIRATYTDLSEEIRLIGKTESINIRLTKLREQILEFNDLILEEYKPTEQKFIHQEDTTSSQPENFIEPVDVQSDQYIDRIDKNKTKYELLKEKFKKNREVTQIYSDSVFEGKGIFKVYRSQTAKFKLSNININLKLGEITVVVGENGNGKTTLLRIIAGELAASAGTLNYPYFTLSNKTDLSDIKNQIAYIPQELPKWYGLLADNLHFAASIHGITGQDNQDEVDFIIARLGLEQYKKATWNEISGGYKMRFSLARAMVCNPKLIILDEPLANLDINTQVLFLQDLRDLANSSVNPIAIIVSSQLLYEVENIANNIIFLQDGQAAYNGSVQNFGENRKENSYEISCDLSKEQIIDILEKIQFSNVKKTGSSFIIHTALSVSSTDLLKLFIEQNISLKYFRDISKSTRKMFKDLS